MTEGLTSETEIKIKNPLTAEHTIYRIGKQRVPSVTTLLSYLNLGGKYQALMGWQLKMMRQGIDPTAAKDEAGTVGTLVHLMVRNLLTGYEVQRSFFSEDQIRAATRAFHGFRTWWEENEIKPIEVEWKLIHKRLRYGGTIDLWLKWKKGYLLADIKSATKVYLDHRIQLAAYSELARHRTGKSHDCAILHLDKNTGAFTFHPFPDLTRELKCFKLCVQVYNLDRSLSHGQKDLHSPKL